MYFGHVDNAPHGFRLDVRPLTLGIPLDPVQDDLHDFDNLALVRVERVGEDQDDLVGRQPGREGMRGVGGQQTGGKKTRGKERKEINFGEKNTEFEFWREESEKSYSKFNMQKRTFCSVFKE